MELTIENYKSNVLTPGNQLKVDWAHKWDTDMDFAGLNSQLPRLMPRKPKSNAKANSNTFKFY